MFNVGGPEILVIFLVALVVLGPQQLPKAMRTFGSVMAEVRKVSNSFQAEMRDAMDSVVDTSATEKPQSAKMASAEPAPSSNGSEGNGSMTEVTARNDSPAEVTEGAGESPGSLPPVDPADRAAG